MRGEFILGKQIDAAEGEASEEISLVNWQRMWTLSVTFNSHHSYGSA